MNKLLFLLLLLILNIYSKNIQVPAVKVKEEKDIRMRSLVIMEEPDFNFSSVYSREVCESKNGTCSPFSPCIEEGPEVEFFETDEAEFKEVPIPPLVIYKFEDIKYSQFLLDIMVKDDKIYVMFVYGKVGVYRFNSTQEVQFTGKKVFEISGLTDKKLEIGYFAQAGDDIIFMNSNYAIKVQEDQATVLKNYQSTPRFQTVISVGEKYVAAAYAQMGVKIFRVDGDSIVFVTQLSKENFSTQNALQLADLAYDCTKKILFVLDEDDGIYAFNVTETASNLSLTGMIELVKKPLCDLMYLYENDLYVSCDEVVKINIQKLPKVNETVLMHPNIKIRQIYANKNVVAFVGRNVFKLTYMGRLVSYYEDRKMDKLLFTEKYFISANEDGLYIGGYNIIEPYIACQTSQRKFLGTHHLVFTTKAKCDKSYFAKYNINQKKLGEIDDNDMCIYTAYRDVYLWEVGEIFMLPILIAILIFVFIAFIISLVYCIKKIRLKKLMKELSEYEQLNPTSGNHVDLVEEEDPHKSSASNKNEDDEEPKPVELNGNENLHDIE